MTLIESSPPLELRHAATDRATFIVVPPRRLLAIDGNGGSDAADFQFATTVVRAAGQTLRARLRRQRSITTLKAPIECAWWTRPELPIPEMLDAFDDRTTWYWRQMVEIPDQATYAEALAALDEYRQLAGRRTPLTRILEWAEGRAAQMLHIGTEDELASIQKLIRAITDARLTPAGHLHEILLCDPGLVPHDRVRMIVRLPVRNAEGVSAASRS